jgi:hypothetical protein
LLLAAIACAWSAARAAADENDWHCQTGTTIGSTTPKRGAGALDPADNDPAHYHDIGDRLRADVCYRKVSEQPNPNKWIYDLSAVGEASNLRGFSVVASVQATLSAFLDGKRVMFGNRSAFIGRGAQAPDGHRTSNDLTDHATTHISVPRGGTLELFANASAVFKHWLLWAPDTPANATTWTTAGLRGIGTTKLTLKTGPTP